MKYKAPRGTQDILPDRVNEWQDFERASSTVLSRYGYREIRTPVFEQKELFQRTVGRETDIVQKEMYCFRDRKDREFALRPEGTAPVIRSYIQNALWTERRFQKLYYIGPMFRYDRPQKGRYRQFHQVGAEAIGSLSPLVDAEVIALMGEILQHAAGIKRLILKLNSLGDRESRMAYASALREYFAGSKDMLCPDCTRRLELNPLRVLDCKVPACRELAADIPPMEECLNLESREHYLEVQHWLEVLGVPFEKDKSLVRGLDYYTRTTFEYHHGELGASVALGGGGRYDLLIAECGGPDTPAIGFSLGTERVLLAASRDMEPNGDKTRERKKTALYMAWLPEQDVCREAFKLAHSLRSMVRVEMDLEPRSLKAQFRQADKLGASHVVIMGSEELSSRQVKVKEMATGRQESVRISELQQYVSGLIK